MVIVDFPANRIETLRIVPKIQTNCLTDKPLLVWLFYMLREQDSENHTADFASLKLQVKTPL